MTSVNQSLSSRIGAVVIGRNEGQRLLACLASLKKHIQHIVYVDSGSTDNSLDNAEQLGVTCVSLDLSIPFTAARARNEGARALLEARSDIDYIQFIDGDCELRETWSAQVVSFLDQHPEVAIACGRRRERYPDASIWNALCDIEWDTPIGEAKACGGDAMIRTHPFKAVEGYRDSLIAGEEPEMCYRMRQQGWKIMRLDAEMTLHDAAMTRLGQWWQRAKRAGYAYAASCYLHGRGAEKFKVKEVRSIVVWAFAFPLLVILLAFMDVRFLALVLLYPLQVIRLTARFVKLNRGWKVAFLYALTTVLGKFPQFAGLLSFMLKKIRKQEEVLIEYK